MRRILLKSKIHRATVTGANIEYEGSISIPTKLMRKADILPFEQVQVYNITNGQRFITYAIEGRTENDIIINGAAARLCSVGDRIIVASYAEYDEEEAQQHKPKIIVLDDKNNEQ